ncbi:hypothetical protein ACYZUD_01320 [Pseudomonas sp. XS1P51]
MNPFNTTAPLRTLRRQRGSVYPMMLLVMGGMLLAGGFAVDSVALNSDTSQLKRATDAAALALGRSYSPDEDGSGDQQTMAQQYVRANLGLNSAVLANLGTITVTSGTSSAGNNTFKVSATLTNVPLVLNTGNRDVTISSTSEVRQVSTEVALALPNTTAENSANLAALRRLGKTFAQDLIGDSSNTWLSLVPYSQSVNVYDPNQTGRIRSWAASGALNPVELTSLFQSGYGSLADRRMPDRIANLLCMYRGLDRGENYFWDEAPGGRFKVYYRADLAANGSPGAEPISWIGPNPAFGEANGANDTRYLVADRGCPHAQLLPLTNNQQDISARLDKMTASFNVNFAIAMGWSAMALAPEFRGSSGWALEDDLPKEFDDGTNERIKAIVFLVNSTDMNWFDSDAYNAYVGESIDGSASTPGSASATTGSINQALITQRFTSLCNSFRAHNLKFYLIVTGSDESTGDSDSSASGSTFRRVAGAGLAACAEQSADLTYLNGADFVASEGAIQARLESIIEELRQQSNFVRLIE